MLLGALREPQRQSSQNFLCMETEDCSIFGFLGVQGIVQPYIPQVLPDILFIRKITAFVHGTRFGKRQLRAKQNEMGFSTPEPEHSNMRHRSSKMKIVLLQYWN